MDILKIFIKTLCEYNETTYWKKMNVILNGKEVSLDKKLNLKDFLIMHNVKENNIVIEINRNIITKSLWHDYELKDNDKIEIITAVGGG